MSHNLGMSECQACFRCMVNITCQSLAIPLSIRYFTHIFTIAHASICSCLTYMLSKVVYNNLIDIKSMITVQEQYTL